jgi:hypothetical protein
MAAACLAAPLTQALEWTWTYAVQATADVSTSPPRITLHWVQDEIPATGYTVWRKAPGDATWSGNGISLSGDATSFTDENVSGGSVYEYQIRKSSSLYSAYGYVTVPINAPLVESRGKLVLVVDNSVAGALGNELRRLQNDLIGDGWSVIRKDVARDERPENIRRAIQGDYQADPANVKAVFLFGHVPIARSGNLNIDGHQARPMPADVYYGEMNSDWTDNNGDGVFDQNTIPSDVELAVGRVDFADLPGAYTSFGLPNEIDLLRRYLDKDHAYRHAIMRPSLRALVGNGGGDAGGQAYAASGYRSFAPLVGPQNVISSGIELYTPVNERFIGRLTSDDYLWSYASAGGGDFSIGQMGTHGAYNDLWGSDLVEFNARSAFYLFFGSWFGEWSKQDNLLRTALATPDYGLAAAWSGRPHLFFHPMGAGATLGDSIRLSQNNSGTYQNQAQRLLRGVHIALLGDPALRLYNLAPPTELRANSNGNEVSLTWNGSRDSVLGYLVYRSSGGGPFTRVTNDPISGTNFNDRPGNPNDAIYMVRAVTLQQSPSGTYYNASEGVFSRDDIGSIGVSAGSAIPAFAAPASPASPPPNNQNSGPRSPPTAALVSPLSNQSIVLGTVLHLKAIATDSSPGRITNLHIDIERPDGSTNSSWGGGPPLQGPDFSPRASATTEGDFTFTGQTGDWLVKPSFHDAEGWHVYDPFIITVRAR